MIEAETIEFLSALSPKYEFAPNIVQMLNGCHLGPHGWIGLKGLDLYVMSIKFHLIWIREAIFCKALTILHFFNGGNSFG